MMNRYLVAVLAGLLFGAGFPPSPAGPLMFAAAVPLLLLLAHTDTMRQSRKSLIGMFYVTFFVYHGLTNWWVSSWQEHTDPYLVASGLALWLAHPLFLSLPWYALAHVRRRFGVRWMLALAPFACAGGEWLHGQTDASYPWLSIGYGLIDTPFSQAADLVGVYGLGLGCMVVNVMLAALILHWRIRTRRVAMLAAIATVTGLWFTYGVVRYDAVTTTLDQGEVATLEVAMVQPNEDPWDKWSDPREQLRRHLRMVDADTSLRKGIDLLVWSETAIPFAVRTAAYEPEWIGLRRWIDTTGVALLTGYSDLVVYADGEAPPSARRSSVDSSIRYDHFNAAMLVQPYESRIDVHRKTCLTPFAERLPFADQLTFATSWIQWGVGISSWGKGTTRLPLMVATREGTIVPIGVVICIESIYPEMVADVVDNGAEALCIITNDAWYNGTPGPRQHYAIARMRAIEQRRAVFRCANSGITGIIDPAGRSQQEVAPQTATICRGRVPRSTVVTVYAMLGDIAPVTGLVLTLVAVVAGSIPAVLRKMQVRPTQQEDSQS